MEFKYKLWSLFVILSIAKVSHGQLSCYVCENCPDITNVKVPLVTCDEDFFNSGGTSEPSTQTTTDLPASTASSTQSITTEGVVSTSSSTIAPTTISTTTIISTTTDNTSESSSTTTTTKPIATTQDNEDGSSQTTEETTTETVTTTPVGTTIYPTSQGTDTTTDNTTKITTTESTPSETTIETTSSTQAQPPTPPTANPGTSIPTPPNPGSVKTIDDSVIGDIKERSTPKNYVTSSEFRVRQLRSVSDYTYHCYKVMASVNGSMTTNRGCTRVTTTESVCGKWKQQNPTEQLSRCYPCSVSRCNGSTALNVSVAALALAIVAALLQRK